MTSITVGREKKSVRLRGRGGGEDVRKRSVPGSERGKKKKREGAPSQRPRKERSLCLQKNASSRRY